MKTPDDIGPLLAATLDDHRLSRSERQVLERTLEELGSAADPQALRRKAFEVARNVLGQSVVSLGKDVVDWLEAVVKAIERPSRGAGTGRPEVAEVHFSPGDDCRIRIAQLLDATRKGVDICVFTITDDRISNRIVAAHRRGVVVRVISDDNKSGDEGSDVGRFRSEGIAVRVDRSEFHMHHKFAVFDGELILSGSYNWTRGAAECNEENLLVTNDTHLVEPYSRAFEHLWEKLA
jgi:phosphatidylserine/phosphatidylglycerophosphate/cardiolipin synthase-like enzyme